jgi:hypothetical protein
MVHATTRAFLRSDAGYGVQIMDRRDTELPELLKQGVEGRNTFHIKLNIKRHSPWVLNYYLPEALLEDSTRESDRRFNILIVVVLFLVFVAL